MPRQGRRQHLACGLRCLRDLGPALDGSEGREESDRVKITQEEMREQPTKFAKVSHARL